MAALEAQAGQVAALTARIESAGAARPGQANPVQEIAGRLEQIELVQSRLAEELGQMKRVQVEAVEGLNTLIEQIHSLLRA